MLPTTLQENAQFDRDVVRCRKLCDLTTENVFNTLFGRYADERDYTTAETNALLDWCERVIREVRS